MSFQVYPRRNRALVKALYQSLREHLISLAEFADMLRIVMGKQRIEDDDIDWHDQALAAERRKFDGAVKAAADAYESIHGEYPF